MNPTSGCGADQDAYPWQWAKKVQCGTESLREGQQTEKFHHQNRQSRSTVLRQGHRDDACLVSPQRPQHLGLGPHRAVGRSAGSAIHLQARDRWSAKTLAQCSRPRPIPRCAGATPRGKKPYVVEHLAHSPGGSFPMVPFNLTWCATKQASQTTIRSLKGDTCCKKFIQEMGKLALVPAGKKRTQERSGRWSQTVA